LRLLEPDRQAVFRLDAAGQHVELQLADDPDDPAAADRRLEQLGRALLGELRQRLVEVLGLQMAKAASRN
jgi:hypothetical protein